MLAPVTHILPLTSIRRVRTLPVPGQVLVRVGQKVAASELVAQAVVPAEHKVLDIRRGLGVPQTGAAERAIVRQVGDKLEKGDVIAETGGLFSRMVRAPAAGEIVSIGGGQVLLRVSTRTVEVRAGLAGTVTEVIAELGAAIETTGALVQGAWGNGQIDSGLLLVVAHTPDEELTRPAIDVSMRGAVVLAGHCASQDALRAGAEMPLRGLILASMTADLLPYASNLKYPIFVLEGFGKIPMNDAAYRLLSSSEKREVSINAAFNPVRGERPELIIPLPSAGTSPRETDYFAPGQIVRIQGAPYAGMMGTITQVKPGLEELANGLRALTAEVQLDSDTRVLVPLANLEVIE